MLLGKLEFLRKARTILPTQEKQKSLPILSFNSLPLNFVFLAEKFLML